MSSTIIINVVTSASYIIPKNNVATITMIDRRYF